MTFDFSDLEEKSIKLPDKLRLKIDSLEIKYDSIWTNFKDLNGTFLTPTGNKLPLGLREILLDTGNEAGYCLMSAHFIDEFRMLFPELEFKSKNTVGIQGNDIRTLITAEMQRLRLLDIEFYSKIGFRYDIDKESINIVNVGIDSLIQFLNIIFNDGEFNYYYCSNL